MAKTSVVKLALNIILGAGESPVSTADIVAALRAQADALEGKGAKAKPAAKPKATKKAKEEDEDDDTNNSDADSDGDESGEDEGDDDSSDADEDSDDAEGEDADEDSDDGDDESEDADDSEEDEGGDGEPSKEEVLGLLKKLTKVRKSREYAMKVMKKVTGKETIHAVKKPGMLGKLAAALNAELKKKVKK